MNKLLTTLLLFFTSSLTHTMEHTAITIPSEVFDESAQISTKAVEIYFRGNAKTLHETLLPLIRAKIKEDDISGDTNIAVKELKNIPFDECCNTFLSDHIHNLVSSALEQAFKDKERALQELRDYNKTKDRQRNIAIGTALVSLLGATSAALTHLSQ